LTADVEFWSVVQVMVAPVLVIPLAVTAEMAGGGVVVKVKLPEVVVPPEPFVETRSKLYMVPGVRPVNVTECDVTDPAPEPEEP
jgi:hypothetical protein